MLRWQGETLAPEQLDFYRRPYHPGYFTDGSGKPLNRTVFDYLCDHLGDRLHLLDCRIHRDVKNKGFTHEICFMLLNTGFALPYTLRRLSVAITGPDGSTAEYEASYQLRSWPAEKRPALSSRCAPKRATASAFS